jgi:hypothetical protein
MRRRRDDAGGTVGRGGHALPPREELFDELTADPGRGESGRDEQSARRRRSARSANAGRAIDELVTQPPTPAAPTS